MRPEPTIAVRTRHGARRGAAQLEHVVALSVAVVGLASLGNLGGAFHGAIAGSAAGRHTDGEVPTTTQAALPAAQAGVAAELAHLAERARQAAEPFDDARTLVHEASRRRLDKLVNGTDLRDLVVVPSLTLDPAELAGIKAVGAYEERVLWSLRNLQRPGTRVTFVTSTPIDADFRRYFLELIPGHDHSDLKRRTRFLSVDDPSPEPLARKLLRRPGMLENIRDRIDPRRSVLLTWTSSPYDAGVAEVLGVPQYGPHPLLTYYGTKSGGRELFREAGVPIPFGFEHVKTTDEVVAAVNEIWKREPDVSRVVVKHNEGTSGQGNAILDLRKLQEYKPGRVATDAERKTAIRNALSGMEFAADDITPSQFFEMLEAQGGVVEAFFDHATSSPSSQIDVYADGRVMPAATHDQVLGGPGNQVFAGASFPARSDYRLAMQDDMRRVGELLRKRGVIGRFAGDFMVRASAATGGLERIAIELNLRQGGTTHPGRILEMIAGGGYDAARGVYLASDGKPRVYVSTDTFVSPALVGRSPGEVIEQMRKAGLLYDNERGSGMVFHMVGGMKDHGKVGFTAIARTRSDAQHLFTRVQETLGTKP